MSPRSITPALLLRKSDAELAALVTAGHDAAFGAIVLRHRAQLLRHCRRLLRDHRAEDAMQQTFLRALQALRRGTEVRELRPWLHQIAHNVALSELTIGKQHHAELNNDWEDSSRSDEYDRRVALRETLLAVDALPDRQRAALLRSAAGETPDAIGRELGVTSMAVRQLVHRARVSVRAAVRVICPPPLIWLSRRAASAFEKIPGTAGAPAGAAPVASKIAVAVIVSATVAAPATVLHGVLTHHPRPVHRHRLVASRPAAAASHPVAARRAFVPPIDAGPALPVATAPQRRAPFVAHAVRSRLAVAASPPRTRSASQPSSPAGKPSGDGAGVSASSPNSAPVGTGSSSANSSAGTRITAGPAASGAAQSGNSAVGPTASASASSPAQASAGSADSSSSASTGTDTTSTDPGAPSGSTDTSGTAAGGPSTSP